MLKKIGMVVGALLLGLLAFAATRPNSFEVQRSIAIKAPADKIVGYILDFHRWNEWSPWEKLDPAMKRTYSGATSGQGAKYAWEGNGQVGAGSMEITQAVPPSKVTIKLDFLKPFEGHNVAEFDLLPSGDVTQVTWAMHGPSPYVSKLMGIFVSMEQLIGKDFEKGLAQMKAAAEK